MFFPVGVFVWQIRRMRRGTLSRGRAVTGLFFISIIPVVFYALAFFLAVAIEEVFGIPVVAEEYARSLLLVMAVSITWVLLMTAVFAILVMFMSRKRI
jgi:hypothetical protein